MKVEILVATHKEIEVSGLEEYKIIQVGAEGKEDLGYYKDNDGENISLENPNFSELTALYWFWKNNSDYNVVVFNHYRRMFLTDEKELLTKEKVSDYLKEYDVLVPFEKKYPVSISQQYEIMHYKKDMDIVKEILSKKYLKYNISLWDDNKSYLYNMFGMRKKDFENMMTFVFDVLFEAKEKINLEHYNQQQSRVYGFLSERLISLYIRTKFENIKELPIKFIDKNNNIKVMMGSSNINNMIYILQKPVSYFTTQILKKILVSKSK